MDRARIEDFLKLAVRTDPPVMNGNLHMKARIFIPPGNVPVTDKIQLNGNFEVSGAYFSSDKIQDKIDLLSRLGQGHPKDPDLHVSPPQPEVKAPAEVQGDFALANGSMSFSDLNFSVPGALIDMAGVYTLDGNKFDFHGQAKLARPSFANDDRMEVGAAYHGSTRSLPSRATERSSRSRSTARNPILILGWTSAISRRDEEHRPRTDIKGPSGVGCCVLQDQ